VAAGEAADAAVAERLGQRRLTHMAGKFLLKRHGFLPLLL
jgi:hypothetical protein